MTEPIFPADGWFKSSFSEPNGGNCVDVNLSTPGFVAVRHSKRPDGAVIVYDTGEWRAFLLGALNGEFDLPEA